MQRGPLRTGGKLARRWLLWVVAAIVAFLAASAIAIAFLSAHLQSKNWEAATGMMFSVSCAASSFAFLGLFLRFARSRSRIFESLSRNSYGIYLVHYAFVNWLQLALVDAPMPGILKFAIVVCGAVAASWLTTIALRRIPGVARVV